MMEENGSNLNASLKFLAKSSFLVFITIVLSKLLGYIYKIVVARYYGPEAYGLLILAFTIFGWFILFSQFGLGAGILRYISFYRGKKKINKISYIVKFFLGFLLTTGIVAGILLFFFSDLIAEKIFSNAELSIFLKLFSIMLPISGLRTVLTLLMQAYEKVKWVTFTSKISDNLFKLITIFILISLSFDPINIPLSYVVASTITLLISYSICKISFKEIFKIKPKKDKVLIKKIFSYSLPLIFFGVSMSLISQADSFMLGIFKTVEDVGLYNAAVPIALLLSVAVDLFGLMFFPIATKEYAKGNIGIVKQLSQQTGKWVYILSLPLFILLMIFPGLFIKLFFGEEYLIAVNALRFLSIGIMFFSISELSKLLVLIKAKPNLIFKYSTIVLVLNIVLNLLLIPKYGINGAAFSTMVSFICLGTIFGVQSWKLLKILPLRRKMVNVTFAVIIPTILLLLIRKTIEANLPTMILSGILFVAVYILLLFLTGSLDRNDKLILDLIKKKFYGKKQEKDGK